MPNIKTAISLPRALFERVNELAQDLQVPRSRIFVLALEEFISRQENRGLLARINSAYPEMPEAGERKRLRQMRRSHRRIIEGEW